jgi:hypothetical protein
MTFHCTAISAEPPFGVPNTAHTGGALTSTYFRLSPPCSSTGLFTPYRIWCFSTKDGEFIGVWGLHDWELGSDGIELDVLNAETTVFGWDIIFHRLHNNTTESKDERDETGILEAPFKEKASKRKKILYGVPTHNCYFTLLPPEA